MGGILPGATPPRTSGGSGGRRDAAPGQQLVALPGVADHPRRPIPVDPDLLAPRQRGAAVVAGPMAEGLLVVGVIDGDLLDPPVAEHRELLVVDVGDTDGWPLPHVPRLGAGPGGAEGPGAVQEVPV